MPDAVTDEFLVAAPPGITAADLTVAVGCGGGTGTRVVRADPHELGDVPTRVLHLAARAGAGSADLPAVLGDLFSGAEVRHLPGSAVEEYAGETIRLRDPDGRVLAVTRPDLPFTPAEFARARALVGCAPPASDFARLADVTATGEDG